MHKEQNQGINVFNRVSNLPKVNRVSNLPKLTVVLYEGGCDHESVVDCKQKANHLRMN